jgi:hypothetical protein
MASINWVKYHVGDHTVEIYNLDQAHYFRHSAKGVDSEITFEVQDDKFHIMKSVDPDAYTAILAYIRSVTGHELE